MSIRLRLVVLAAAVLLPAAAPADVTTRCQRAIATGGGKFARAALKLGQRCAMKSGNVAGACQPHAGATTGNAALDGGIARATSRLAAHVSTACATSELSAFARRCPDPTGPPLSLAELVSCLQNTHLDRVGAMIAVEFPSPAAAPADAAGCATGEACQCACSASPSGAFIGNPRDVR
jgi:hypothetical protein